MDYYFPDLNSKLIYNKSTVTENILFDTDHKCFHYSRNQLKLLHRIFKMYRKHKKLR
jgi:hypothetical protein